MTPQSLKLPLTGLLLLPFFIFATPTFSFVIHHPNNGGGVQVRRGITNNYDKKKKNNITPLIIQTITKPSLPSLHATPAIPAVATAITTVTQAINLNSIRWVMGTILGGTLGTPFVLIATKTWYNTIPLPPYTPPNYIFGPVWSFLYTCMGIASWRIRQQIRSTSTAAAAAATSTIGMINTYIMLLSFIHFILNITWAPIFFGAKRLRLGHVWNILIWTSLLPVIVGYSIIDVTSGLLLLPYFVWLTFAIRLSHGICTLNPTSTNKKRDGRLLNNAMFENEIWKLRKEAGRKVGL